MFTWAKWCSFFVQGTQNLFTFPQKSEIFENKILVFLGELSSKAFTVASVNTIFGNFSQKNEIFIFKNLVFSGDSFSGGNYFHFPGNLLGWISLKRFSHDRWSLNVPYVHYYIATHIKFTSVVWKRCLWLELQSGERSLSFWPNLNDNYFFPRFSVSSKNLK